MIHFLLSFGSNYYIIYIHCHYHSLSRCRSWFIFSSHSVAIIISSTYTATITASPAVVMIHFLLSFVIHFLLLSCCRCDSSVAIIISSTCALPLSQSLPLSLWFIFSSHSVAIIISSMCTATITVSPAVAVIHFLLSFGSNYYIIHVHICTAIHFLLSFGSNYYIIYIHSPAVVVIHFLLSFIGSNYYIIHVHCIHCCRCDYHSHYHSLCRCRCDSFSPLIR